MYPSFSGGIKKRKVTPRPTKICPLCHITVSRLPEHLRAMHKANIEVQKLLLFDKMKNSEGSNKILQSFRKRSLQFQNEVALKEGSLLIRTERGEKPVSAVVQCNGCAKFLTKDSFRRHSCPGKTKTEAGLYFSIDEDHEAFMLTKLFERMREDTIGNFCRSEPIVKRLGIAHYMQAHGSQHKEQEINEVARNRMREIARLFFCFKDICQKKGYEPKLEDMFHSLHIQHLQSAIIQLTTATDKSVVRHGQRVHFGNLMKGAIEDLAQYFNFSGELEKEEQILKFKHGFSYVAKSVIAKSEKIMKKERLTIRTAPKSLQKDEDVHNFHIYCKRKIKDTISSKLNSKHDYYTLRKLICSRLTIFNGRRGGEVSRLEKEEAMKALSDEWIQEESMAGADESTRELLTNLKLRLYMASHQEFLYTFLKIVMKE